LNLNELIHFSEKTVVVYPDETQKPDVGKGLNKSAEITLEKCFPRDGSSEKFTIKLKKLTEKQGAHFIDYNPTTGEWKFKVDRF